ncbi:hypothetical protein GCM10008967_19990 [Bacillus carboniphilus]|uniref:Uncharacterized protein n=1 Tax=Bacillus carboniphilus TaxID=86663 RepID=A0ABP3G0B2_9BACI
MVQNDKSQYKVTSGPYKDKAQGLKFGYEYTTGNQPNKGSKNTNNK